ncbi:unnamed protein product [Cyprideis torosa]|uniref:Uncharacterized protein n=1 Tax=Cyprideis torosa TaxID=163714 RepID=A0A7R8W5K3_9CRUS|nr:unnamed protein product [Cyprideis torosa]CAG0885408.1 unnamed protein product [Cyprideis torosa]
MDDISGVKLLDGTPDPFEPSQQSGLAAAYYGFTGMYHIFDHHSKAVPRISFANADPSLLCCASLDNTLSLCRLHPSPKVIHVMKGPKAGITDIQWSLSDDRILSCSLDGSLWLWNAEEGSLLRAMPFPIPDTPLLACRFHSLNNNYIAVGSAAGHVQTLNISTGTPAPKDPLAHIGHECPVLSLCVEPQGTLLWAGDAQGNLTSFRFDGVTGALEKLRQVSVALNRSVSSVNYKAWFWKGRQDPCLLVNVSCDALCLFRVCSSSGEVMLRRKFQVFHTQGYLRSTFSPSVTSRNHGVPVVSGSEDGAVYFFDAEGQSSSPFNVLQGHSRSVLDVSFSADESFLASADADGVVIVWNRQPRQEPLPSDEDDEPALEYP